MRKTPQIHRIVSMTGLSLACIGAIAAAEQRGQVAAGEDLWAAQRASQVAAARDEGHPERRAPLAPPAFDTRAYQQDPLAYLSRIEPGRAYQSATPGEQVPAAYPADKATFRIARGGAAALRVQAVAGAPVSFLSQGGGVFDNGLTAITVPTDAEGVAQVTFTATPGTGNLANVIAACPVASGRVRFAIWVGE